MAEYCRAQEIGLLNNAALNGDTDEVLKLLDEGADVNERSYCRYKRSYTPLFFAATNGYIDILEILLDNGANMDAVDFDGYTALMHALREEQFDAAEFLILKGANLNIVDGDCGDNVLTICAEYGDLRLFDLLIVYGATDINHIDCYGMTPLMNAILMEKYDIAERLMELICELDFQSTAPYWYKGFTALMIACAKGNLEIVKMLVKSGCDINIKSSEGETAIDISIKYNHPDVTEYLRQYY